MQQTVRGILNNMQHCKISCIGRDEDISLEDTLVALQELIKTVLEENEMQDHMAYKAELKDALCKLFK